MVWVCYSSSTNPGWFYHPDGVVFNDRGGCIPQKGWLYPPIGVVLSPQRGGFIRFFKCEHKTTRGGFTPHWGWFYVGDHKVPTNQCFAKNICLAFSFFSMFPCSHAQYYNSLRRQNAQTRMMWWWC